VELFITALKGIHKPLISCSQLQLWTAYQQLINTFQAGQL